MKIADKIVIVLGIALASCAVRAQIPLSSILWLRADSGVVLQNGHVAVWKDQSGHGNDATMSAGQQPDFLRAASDGRPALVFHGWNYMTAPAIFPVRADYTVAVVAKLNDTTAINNLFSGDSHALYFANNRYPRIVHQSFLTQEVATVPVWTSAPSEITASYSEAYGQATLYVNGQFADSSYVAPTADSTILIGSFQHGYFLQGEIQELILYPRELSPSERDSLSSYLMLKYGIERAPAPPKPDSTFSEFPKELAVYPRGTDDSATVPISGTIYSPGFDSIYTLEYKNGIEIARKAEPLQYDNAKAMFGFQFRIHAELCEYRFEVHLSAPGFDSIIATRDSIVCGDIFLMDGQSNAYNGFQVDTFRNEYCRTFGKRGSENLRDTAWAIADAGVGAADQRIQQDIVSYDRIPVCSINESLGGTNIESHEANDSNEFDLRTMYGREIYRTMKSGMSAYVHTLFWLQGESNYAPGYYDKFLTLYRSWHHDLPNLQKLYLLQIRPNYCTFGNIDMRDVQRLMGDSLSDVEPIAAAALLFQNGCHYFDSGYRFMGDRFYFSLARDFYHVADTANLRSPNATWAWWTHPDHHQVGILFSPPNAILHATDDTTVDGIFATLKDYFYPDDNNSHVQSIAFDNDTLFINLDAPGNTQSIAYLPDQYYNGSDSAIYEGPWIVNQRGYAALLWCHLPIEDSPFSGITNTPLLPEMRIFPNPTSCEITFDAPNFTGPLTVRLLSETGAIFWNEMLPADHAECLTLDFSGEPSGFYLLQLSNGTHMAEQKFILAR